MPLAIMALILVAVAAAAFCTGSAAFVRNLKERHDKELDIEFVKGHGAGVASVLDMRATDYLGQREARRRILVLLHNENQ